MFWPTDTLGWCWVVISACYLFIIYNLVSGSGAELSAAKSWITQLHIHIRALKILSSPIQIQNIQIIFILHTTPHNLTKIIIISTQKS